ncbi:MAG: hypothetical protein Q4F71_00715 [Paracoccus sp. (in: a-proteobacteria)]|nr:hypothetical protein [Paracoccus sp. (in: a-proteobacteria)]
MKQKIKLEAVDKLRQIWASFPPKAQAEIPERKGAQFFAPEIECAIGACVKFAHLSRTFLKSSARRNSSSNRPEKRGS